MGQEADRGRGLGVAVLQRAQDVEIHRTSERQGEGYRLVTVLSGYFLLASSDNSVTYLTEYSSKNKTKQKQSRRLVANISIPFMSLANISTVTVVQTILRESSDQP